MKKSLLNLLYLRLACQKILCGFCMVGLVLLATSQKGYTQCSVYPNLLTANLNSANSTLSISEISCEPCRVGVGENRNRCICREDCKRMIPPESLIDEIQNDCIEDCADEFPNDPNSYHHCLGYCDELPFQDYYDCLSDCGNYSQLRRPVEYEYRIGVWYATGFVPSFTGDPDEIFQSENNGAPPETISVSLMNTPSGSYSYCYFTFLEISYDDGTCCHFINAECVSIG
ncbi:hypothetical protein [Phaeodactylibacter xiamenensis]|uniref:hypothetical protein n=1 Tax=Phaeodactylibacter xiamenensis TaxID=1524460 RepID=UPI003BABDC8D